MTKNQLKIQWLCRRGMLEPQLMLERFIEKNLFMLTRIEEEILLEILTYPDPVLYDWLLGLTLPENPKFLEMVGRIRA